MSDHLSLWWSEPTSTEPHTAATAEKTLDFQGSAPRLSCEAAKGAKWHPPSPKPMVMCYLSPSLLLRVAEAQPAVQRAIQEAPSVMHYSHSWKPQDFLGSILVYLMANYTSENIFQCDLPCHTVHLETSPPSQHTHSCPTSVYVYFCFYSGFVIKIA